MHLHILFGFIKAFNATKIRLHVTEQIEMQPGNINLISELLQHFVAAFIEMLFSPSQRPHRSDQAHRKGAGLPHPIRGGGSGLQS